MSDQLHYKLTGNFGAIQYMDSTSSFENYINNSSSAQDTRMSAIILDFESTDNEISGVEVGDVMHVYNSSTHRSYDHAIVITDVFSANRNDIYFCAHTTDRKDLKVSDYYPVGTYGELRLIKPMLFTIVTNCPNGSHTYSSVSVEMGSMPYVIVAAIIDCLLLTTCMPRWLWERR